MKIFFLSILLSTFAFEVSHAHYLNVNYDKGVSKTDRIVIEASLNEVSALMPQSMKSKLPNNIIIKVARLSDHNEIPNEACVALADEVSTDENKKVFIYGNYQFHKNTLTINEAVVSELAKGKTRSTRIACKHKSLYERAIATIIHELTHAYDLNNGRISNSIEFINKAGYKKGLIKTKNKNIEAMRSSDLYELTNITESFAVNMEYFLMDSEFLCRKPSMFNFYKNLLGVDPYPNRSCNVSDKIMVSSPNGYSQSSLLNNRIYRIDYLLASPGQGISSGFGHSMFRIVTCAPERFDVISNRMIPATEFGEKCLNDKMYHLVVSYRANMDDGKLNYMKGLTGGYPSMLFLLNFNDVLSEYNRDELRDITSYPLKLTRKELIEFISRVREEHWNYKGAYKFVTNNCAVESYDLLKSAVRTSELETRSSLFPTGVLKDLNELKLISLNDKAIEQYKASTDQIILAYNKAYGYKISKNEKNNKKAVVKFIDESTTESRLENFTKFTSSDMNAELTYLKERLIVASSFSVLEQQINRFIALKFRKKAADLLMNSKDERVLALSKEVRQLLTVNFSDFSDNGYGVPLNDETVSDEELNDKAALNTEAMMKTEKFLKEMMPVEFAILESNIKNTQTYNMFSLSVRKEFRTKLEIYIKQVLKNLSREDYTRSILLKAAAGDFLQITKVRELIGKELVTEKEILDSKLVTFIKEVI